MVVQVTRCHGLGPEAVMNLIDGEANAAGGRRWSPGERRLMNEDACERRNQRSLILQTNDNTVI